MVLDVFTHISLRDGSAQQMWHQCQRGSDAYAARLVLKICLLTVVVFSILSH